MGLNMNEVILNMDPEKWTVGAIECYKNGCNCRNCFIAKTYKSITAQGCLMKYCVRVLIKKYGLPDDVTLENAIQDERNKENEER